MAKNLPYDPKNKESVITYAKQLRGKSLRKACTTLTQAEGSPFSGKGTFGQTLEKYYFLYEPNSDARPDFADINLELKSTPLKQTKEHQYRAKERLVLSIIDYMQIVEQDFESSSLWKKNEHLLLVFYLHQPESNFLDYPIHIVDEWSFPERDRAIIKKDWEVIKDKVNAGKAHELSEGDTYYLGACTKGKDSSTKRSQPKCAEKAMQRAFALKANYMNHIIASLTKSSERNYGKTIPSLEVDQDETIEEAIIRKFKKYYGKTASEIQQTLGVELNINAKSFFSSLCERIQGFEEIDKAGISVKTVVLPSNGNAPKESLSFPAFRYDELVNETWEESSFKERLENKFLFVFFQQVGTNTVLKKIKLWNMPYEDIQTAKKVWDRTKAIVAEGNIVKSIKARCRYTNFPGMATNPIAHVRPHAVKAKDTYPLPTPDKVTNASEYTKHSFWLNRSYILKIYQEGTQAVEEN